MLLLLILLINWRLHLDFPVTNSLLLTWYFPFREAKLAFKAEVVELQKQLERQQSMFDLLASQASALIQGRRARVSATSSVNTQLITLDEKFSARNLEVHYTICFFSFLHTFFMTPHFYFCTLFHHSCISFFSSAILYDDTFITLSLRTLLLGLVC